MGLFASMMGAGLPDDSVDEAALRAQAEAALQEMSDMRAGASALHRRHRQCRSEALLATDPERVAALLRAAAVLKEDSALATERAKDQLQIHNEAIRGLAKLDVVLEGELAFARALGELLRGTRLDQRGFPRGAAAGAGVEVFALPDWLPVEFRGTLFVRHCTRELLAIVEAQRERCESDEDKLGGGALITGNPGIGKSWSLLYFMIFYLLQGKTVVFESVGQEMCWVLRRGAGGAVSVTCQPDRKSVRELYDPDAIYLFDPAGDRRAREPLRRRAFTVICAEPIKAHYKAFHKLHNFMRVAPVWTLEELLAAAPHHGMAPAVVRGRFLVAGGIPRFVFCGHSLQELKAELMRQLNQVQPSDLAAFAAARDPVSLSLLEIACDADYKAIPQRRALSLFISEALLAKVAELDAAEVVRLARFEPFRQVLEERRTRNWLR